MNVYTLKNSTVEVREENIIIVRVADDVEVSEDDVKEVYNTRKAIMGDKDCAVIIVSGHHASITDEARKLAAHPEYVKNRIAFAMVVTSLAQRIIGNFYIRFDKPPSPTRLFTDEKKALIWVKECIREAK